MITYMHLQLTHVLSDTSNECSSNMQWSSFTNNDIKNYCSFTDENLAKIRLHSDTFACTDLKCDNTNHKNNIDKVFEGIASSSIISCDKKS